MEKIQKHYVESKQQIVEKYTEYSSMYIRFKNMHN